MTRGRYLGIDVGAVRVGVAVCDPGGVLATPLVTVPRDVDGGSDLRAIAGLVAEYEAVGVVVGLPAPSPDGKAPPQTPPGTSQTRSRACWTSPSSCPTSG